MGEWIRRFFTSKYVLMLESENARLLEENRALMNSLLTRAGVQPIDVPKPVARVGSRPSRFQLQTRIERDFLRNAATQEPKRN